MSNQTNNTKDIDFSEAEYTLNNRIRITLNVESYQTEVNTELNGENWVPVVDYVQQLLSQTKQETARHIILNCKERNYFNLNGGHSEFISHNKIVDYIAKLKGENL